MGWRLILITEGDVVKPLVVKQLCGSAHAYL